MQTTSYTTTKVVEKRSNATSQPKPVPQVVDKRSHKTTTTVTTTKTVTPAKATTQVQVVEKRSQKPGTTVKTTTTTTTTVSNSNRPATQVQVANKRSQNTTTTTTMKTSVSPSKPAAKPQVVDNRAHKTVPVKVTTTQVKVVEQKNQRAASKPGSNAASKPQTKAASQAPTKKVEVKKYVYSSVTDDDKIKEAFELFDSNDGRIDAGEVKDAMQNIGYDEKNPVIFQVVSELDNPRNKNSGGATFDDFCQTINYRIPEKETEEELRKIFELFLDPNSETTSLESIKRVADEIGANIEEAELRAMLNKASKSGSELTFDDFVAIMKEKL
jgi:Ca2+-binding EF-hand superfamily protein